MFKSDPFELIFSFLIDKAQRFSLYMLDNYGILVSVWALLSGFVIIATTFIVGFIQSESLPDKAFDYIFLALGIFIFIVPTVVQYRNEKQRNYTKYKVMQVAFAASGYIRYFVIIAVFTFLYLDIRAYLRDHNDMLFGIRLVHEVGYLFFYVFMCCYTRDRDPPFKGRVAFDVQ